MELLSIQYRSLSYTTVLLALELWKFSILGPLHSASSAMTFMGWWLIALPTFVLQKTSWLNPFSHYSILWASYICCYTGRLVRGSRCLRALPSPLNYIFTNIVNAFAPLLVVVTKASDCSSWALGTLFIGSLLLCVALFCFWKYIHHWPCQGMCTTHDNLVFGIYRFTPIPRTNWYNYYKL